MCVGVEEMIRENVLHRIFFSERKTPLTHLWRYKYDAGQEICIGTHESSDVSER